MWRHLPLTDVHPHALLAAEAAEAAAAQGRFWQMHDHLLDHQDALTASDLIRYAGETGLDTGQFTADLRDQACQAKIAADIDSADLSGVSGTPTFFINGKRHHGAYDIATLSDAVRTARAQTLTTPAASSGTRPDHPPQPQSARIRAMPNVMSSGRLLKLSHASWRTRAASNRRITGASISDASISQLYGSLDSESAGGTSAVWRLIVRRSGDRCSKAEPFPRSSGVACSA